MDRVTYYLVNAVTLYRLVAAPFLLFLILSGNLLVFKWLLAMSFFTDAIDGWLARRFKVSSILGAKLDSIADDLTVLVALIAAIVLKPDFIQDQLAALILLLALFAQVSAAFMRYGKMTSFHTYAAKLAAISQGIFFIWLFFVPEPSYLLFYIAVTITALELAEETILVLILPKWRVNVKGLYWVMKDRCNSHRILPPVHDC